MAKRKRLTPLGPMGAPAPTSAPAGSEPQAERRSRSARPPSRSLLRAVC